MQYNLFAGTILALASDKQVGVLDEIQKNGELGCFGLTEKLAGVNSGLVVNTTADWDPDKQVMGNKEYLHTKHARIEHKCAYVHAHVHIHISVFVLLLTLHVL